MLERVWKNRESGRVSAGEAPPPGPGWVRLGEDGNPTEEDQVGLSTRGLVAWRKGGATAEEPKPLKPYNPLRYGLEPGMEGPRGRP